MGVFMSPETGIRCHMLIETIALGMPVAAAFGWWVGRKAPKKKAHPMASRYNLNHAFLGEQSNHRSCLIVEEIYRMNPASIDLRFALAALYREQGDYSRAVEMHQSILEKDQLHSGLYARVSVELARDYLSAGFLDRAEGILDQLVNKRLLIRESLRILLEIYEQTKEWSKAIIIAKRLRYEGEKSDYLIAQYNCELADLALLNSDRYTALMHYQHACLIEPNCVRGNIGMARFYQQRKEYVKAIQHYYPVWDNHPDFLALIVEPMYACYEAIGREDEFVCHLEKNTYYRSFVSVAMVIVKHIHRKAGPEQALINVQEELRSSTSLQLLHLAVLWSSGSSPAMSTGLRLWQEVLERNLVKRKAFSCKHCGHRYDKMDWRCHACNTWAQVVPLIDQSCIHRCTEKLTEFSI